MQAHYEAPASVYEPGPERLVQDWLRFLRSTDAMYERVAEERGEPYQSLGAEELAAVAHLTATLGVEPADAVARLPARCARRLRLQSERLVVGE